jgi:hypothetical protein
MAAMIVLISLAFFASLVTFAGVSFVAFVVNIKIRLI